MTFRRERRNPAGKAGGLAGLLLVGTLVTTIGNAMQGFTLGLILYATTGSAAAFGVILILEQVLTVVMQAVSGPWVDRWHPMRTAYLVEFVRGGLVIGAALAIAAGLPLMVCAVFMTIVIKVGQPFYRAATFALTPDLVADQHLLRLNGWSNTALQAGQLIGVVLAAPAYSKLGFAWNFGINGLSFILSGATLLAIAASSTASPHRPEPIAGGFMKTTRDSWLGLFRILKTGASFRRLLLVNSGDALAVNLFNLLSVPWIAISLHGSPYMLTVLESGYAIAALVFGLLVANLDRHLSPRSLALIGLLGQALCFGLISIAPRGASVLVAGSAMGALNTISWSSLMTQLQLRSDSKQRGRVGAARNLITAVITMILVPAVSHAPGGVRGGSALAGLICGCFGALVLMRPRILQEAAHGE